MTEQPTQSGGKILNRNDFKETLSRGKIKLTPKGSWCEILK